MIQTTALTGNLVQSATGPLLTDINIAGATSDRVNVSGTANFAGTVQVQVQNATLGPWQQTVLSAAGGTTNNGLSLLASPVLQAQLVFPNATDVVVKSAGINFLTPGLNNNQTSLANAFNGAAQTAGLGGPVFNFLLNGVTSLSGYNLALNQLSGEAATGTQQTTFDAMNMFMSLMTRSLQPRARHRRPAAARAAMRPKAMPAPMPPTAASAPAPSATPMRCSPRRRRRPSSSAGACGRPASAARRPPTAMPRSASTARPAASPAPRSAPTICFSPYTIAGFALAGGGTNFSSPTVSAAAGPICSRPASCAPHHGRGLYRGARWPMAGRTSPPTAP